MPAALMALAVALPVLGTSSATAAVETGWPTAVSVRVDPGSAPVYGTTVELSGQVLWAPEGSNEALEGVPVELLRQWRGSDTWSSVGTATTAEPAADGFDGATYTFTLKAKRSASYRVVYDGTPPEGSEDTFQTSEATAKLAVSRDLNDKWKRVGQSYFIDGDVDPGWARSSVALQRQKCGGCAWKVVAEDTTSRAGVFRLPVAFPKKTGTWSYRAVVPGDDAFARSYSRVHQAVTR